MATAASTPASTAGGGGGGDSSVDVGIGAGNAGGGGGDADAGYPYSFNNQNHARLLKRPGSVDGQAFELGFLLHCDVLVLDYTAQVTADYLQHCRVFIGIPQHNTTYKARPSRGSTPTTRRLTPPCYVSLPTAWRRPLRRLCVYSRLQGLPLYSCLVQYTVCWGPSPSHHPADTCVPLLQQAISSSQL